MTSALQGHGLALTVLDGWEARIWVPDLPPPAENDDSKSHAVYQDFIAGRVTGAVDRNYVTHATDLLAFTPNFARKEPGSVGSVWLA